MLIVGYARIQPQLQVIFTTCANNPSAQRDVLWCRITAQTPRDNPLATTIIPQI